MPASGVRNITGMNSRQFTVLGIGQVRGTPPQLNTFHTDPFSPNQINPGLARFGFYARRNFSVERLEVDRFCFLVVEPLAGRVEQRGFSNEVK